MGWSEALPSDMLIEVMARARDVQTLAKMRTMSKSLNFISYTSKFNSLHSVFGFLLQFQRTGEYCTQFIHSCAASECSHPSFTSLDFLPLPVKILAASDDTGLVYCESTKPQSGNNLRVHNHYMCKPATREWMQIPNPKTKQEEWYFWVTMGLVVMRSSPLRYKIIRLCKEPSCNGILAMSYNCQVFDSDEPGKWRTLKKSLQLEGFFESLKLDPPVTVNGKLHFLTENKRIACFDPLTEKWEIYSMPEACHGDFLRPKLVKYTGKLGLILHETGTSLLFWVMDDYDSKEWTECCKIYLKDLNEISSWANIIGFCTSDVALFRVGSYNAVKYNLEKNCLEGTKNRMIKYDFYDSVFKIRSDFERLGWKTEADAQGYWERQQVKANRIR